MLRTTQSFIQVLTADPVLEVLNTQQHLQMLQEDPTTDVRHSASALQILQDDPPVDLRTTGQFLQVLVSDEPFVQEDLNLTEVALVVEDGDLATDTLTFGEINSVQVVKLVFADASDTLALSDIAFSFVVVPIFASASDTMTCVEANTVIQGSVISGAVSEALGFTEVSCVAECVEDTLTVSDTATSEIDDGPKQGLDALTLTESATTCMTYCAEVEESLIIETEVFDPATLTFSTVVSGLTDFATDGLAIGPSLNASDMLSYTERAVGWIIPPGPVDTATDNLNLNDLAQIGQNADRTDTLSLVDLAEAITCINAGDTLTLGEEIVTCHDGTSTAADTLDLGEAFTVCLTPAIESVCDLKGYNPQEGSKSIGVYPDAVDTGFKMTGLVSGATVELPDPNLGNRYRFSPQRINSESRGGTLTIFADPIWPKVRTQQFSFSGMKKEKAIELQTFIDTHLGVLVDLVDHEGRLWQGLIVVVDDPIVEDRRNFWTASFEFEGDLV